MVAKRQTSRHRLARAVHYIRTASAMLALSWQVQPLYCTALTLLLVAQGLLPLGSAWVIKLFFDLLAQSIQAHAPPSLSTLAPQLILLLAAQTGLLTAAQLATPLTQYCTAEVGRHLALRIKINIYQKLNSFTDLAPFEDPRFQNTIQLASNGAQAGPQQALSTFSSLLQGLVTLLTFLGALIALNPVLAALLAIAALPALFIQVKFGRQRFGVAFHNTPKERRASYYGRLLSWAEAAKEVRLFNLGPYFLRAFVEQTRQIQQVQRSQQQRELRWQLPLSLLSGLVSAGAITFVIVQAIAGKLSLGDVSLYMSAVNNVQNALLSLVMAYSLMHQSVLFYRQYLELLNLQHSVPLPSPAKPVPSLTRGITFRNVSFRYNEQHPWVLRHLELMLPANTCLALVGLNGAGKTTLVKLLTRLYDPTEGEILWDGIDLRDFNPEELRQHMGVIFQDFMRYDLTAQHNIGLGNVIQIDQYEVVQQAAMKAGAHERLITLPHGYQSFLGRWLAEDGQGEDLSGGEWQKLALARLYMREADLLILDEPTASLDAQAEATLYEHFRELTHHSTSLLITHRFSTVRMADIIAVLEQGQLMEYGTHEQLLARGGTYAKLYTMQAKQYH